ncbi:uncharacterized protein [Antedon mediterranea]|uniref:uncharacterized protein isoform X2 n=1 Tax=Antedon mediterranea TaxID=105859 RepID=UPI003AF927CB
MVSTRQSRDCIFNRLPVLVIVLLFSYGVSSISAQTTKETTPTELMITDSPSPMIATTAAVTSDEKTTNEETTVAATSGVATTKTKVTSAPVSGGSQKKVSVTPLIGVGSTNTPSDAIGTISRAPNTPSGVPSNADVSKVASTDATTVPATQQDVRTSDTPPTEDAAQATTSNSTDTSTDTTDASIDVTTNATIDVTTNATLDVTTNATIGVTTDATTDSPTTLLITEVDQAGTDVTPNSTTIQSTTNAPTKAPSAPAKLPSVTPGKTTASLSGSTKNKNTDVNSNEVSSGGSGSAGLVVGICFALIFVAFAVGTFLYIRRRRYANNYGRLDEDRDASWSAFSRNPIYKTDDYQQL